MKAPFLGIPLLAMTLTGCATLSEQQCLSADWYQLGRSDALYGHDTHQVELHRRACSKIDVVPDYAAWQAGYAAALPAFCVGGEGYSLGARNGSYHGQCPIEFETGFLDGYRLGQDLYDLNQRIAQEEHEIERLRKAIRDKDATAASREANERLLDRIKRERERLQSQRWHIQDRARERGYPVVY